MISSYHPSACLPRVLSPPQEETSAALRPPRTRPRLPTTPRFPHCRRRRQPLPHRARRAYSHATPTPTPPPALARRCGSLSCVVHRSDGLHSDLSQHECRTQRQTGSRGTGAWVQGHSSRLRRDQGAAAGLGAHGIHDRRAKIEGEEEG